MNSIDVWGSGTWGVGYWGPQQYDIVQDGRNIRTVQRQWDSPLAIAPGSNLHKLLTALTTQSNRIDTDLEEIYEQHHINGATGRELDKWGNLVNVDRRTNESDDTFRARIKAEFRQGTIGTTFDQFSEFCATVLNTNIQNLLFTFNYAGEPAQVTVSADPSVYDSVDLTNQQVRDLLNGGVPAGHEVRVLEGGTFRLKSDGDVDTADEGLTSDQTQDGGALATDLV